MMGSNKSLKSEQQKSESPVGYESIGGPNTVRYDDDYASNKNTLSVSPTSEPKKSSTAAPYNPNKYFPEQKKMWRQQFIEEFQKLLATDDDSKLDEFVVDAFNSHESIRDKKGDTVKFADAEQLKTALADIETGKQEKFAIHQEGRFGLELAYALGIYKYDPLQQGTKPYAELQEIFLKDFGLSKTEVLKYSAIIQYVYSEQIEDKVRETYSSDAAMSDENCWPDNQAFKFSDCFPLAGEMILQMKLKDELKALDQVCENPNTELKLAGQAVAVSVREALNDPSHPKTIESLKQMTQLVRGTTAVIKDPQDGRKLNEHMSNTKAVYQQKWPKAHIIGGALLMVAGAALMALAVTAAVTTFGVSTPLSAVAIAIGAKAMVVGAVLTGVLAGSVLGAGAALVDDGVKTKKSSRFKMFGAGQQLTKAAKKQAKESQKKHDDSDLIKPLNKKK